MYVFATFLLSGLIQMTTNWWSILNSRSTKRTLLRKKAVSHVVNSRALKGEKPCINNAIHALLMHG